MEEQKGQKVEIRRDEKMRGDSRYLKEGNG